MVGSVSYFSLLKNAKTKHFSQVDSTIDQFAWQIENLVNNAQANASLFADNPQVKYYLLTEDESIRYELLYKPLLREFFDIQEAFPQYYELRIILPDGFEDLRSVNQEIANLTEDESQDQLFQQLNSSAAPILSRIRRNPDNGKLACYIYKRIELINEALDDSSSKPQLRGYFSLTAELTTILAAMQNNPLGSKGGLLLSDSSGQLLFVPESLNWLKENPQFLPARTDSESLQEVVFQGMGEEDYFYKRRKLLDGLWIHALLPKQELLQDSQTISRIVAQVTILALFCSVSLLLFILRTQILGPIRKLKAAVLRTGEGEELVQIAVKTDDEFGQLAKEFNKMSHALKISNDHIRSMAYSDGLTQLSNRFMFNRTLKRSIEVARKKKTQFALLYLDLLKFKQVNDAHGHQIGDELLKQLAHRLASNLRSGDVASRITPDFVSDENLARLGGDEFSILLPEIKSSNDAAKASDRIIRLIEEPFVHEGLEHVVSVSIGIAIYPHDGESAVDLIKNADMAMYAAKKFGKGSYEFFSRQLGQQNFERTRMEQRLIMATEASDFVLHYQPILNDKDMRFNTMEALIRWTDKELGPVPPDRFIPVAEDMGLIHSIGQWVLEEACRQVKTWNQNGLEDIRVSVNISGRQFEKPDFAEKILKIIEDAGISTQAIALELTESCLIQEESGILNELKKLRQQGIKIALDDFGTGYSSLSYLKNLPIDILKIDRSFIQGLGQGNNNIVLSAIITMAHALEMQVIAEGLEEQAQLAFLKKENCDFLQGYLFSRPISAEALTKKLVKNLRAKSDSTDLSNPII